MTIWTILAIIFIAFEALLAVNIGNQVAHILTTRAILSGTHCPKKMLMMEARSMLKYLGPGIILLNKAYQVFCFVLFFTKWWYVGLSILALSTIKTIIVNRTHSENLMRLTMVADAILCIALLSLVALNR